MKTNRRSFIQGLAAFGATATAGDVLAEMSLPSDSGVFSGMRGALSAMYTPYLPNGLINEEAIEKLVEFGLRKGLRGFYVTGSTGESMYLSPEERAQVIARTVKANRGRGKIIAHVGYASTDESVKCAKLAEKAGADWISAVAPGFLARRPRDTGRSVLNLTNSALFAAMRRLLNVEAA